jgi:hypothetical protein
MVWPQIVFQILPLVILALLLIFIKRKILCRRFPWTLLIGGALSCCVGVAQGGQMFLSFGDP